MGVCPQGTSGVPTTNVLRGDLGVTGTSLQDGAGGGVAGDQLNLYSGSSGADTDIRVQRAVEQSLASASEG